MDRILDWNKKDQTCTITRPSFEALENTIGIEMFIAQWWEIATLRIRKMETKNNTTTLFFEQPEAHIQSEHPWPAPWLSKETGNSPFYFTNAIQFLDEPGEWYLDTKNKLGYVEEIEQGISEQESILWKSREDSSHKQTPDKTWVYNVFLGVVNSSDITKLLKTMLAKAKSRHRLDP